MKIYTNKNNSQVLKIIISGYYAGNDIPVEIVPLTVKRIRAPKRLPVLELDSGSVIFSSNVACSLISPPPKNLEADINYWLNWDSVNLQVVIFFIGSKFEPSEKIFHLLKELDEALISRHKGIGMEEITLADICLWSTLYPLIKDDKLKSKFLNNSPNILEWSKKLNSVKEFQLALKKFTISSGADALESITMSTWYPPPKCYSVSAENGNTEEPVSQNEILSEEHINKAVDAWNKGVESRVELKQSTKPVLPVNDNKNILITSALPYVNNVPHLGNIIGCVLSADVFARYCRFRHWNTLFICGTDEYGTATETKALEENLTPQEICDKYFAIHDDVYKWFNISFDHFGRTTTDDQKEVVQKMFTSCHRNGYTSTAAVDQLLCEHCNRFLADRFVEGICPDCKYEDARGDQCDGCGHLINAIELINPRCKLCKQSPVVKQSNQLFLELPKVEEKLAAWVEKSSEGWSHNAKVITKAWLKEGLKPRCITRDLKWGVPVPLEGFENKVFYVWFDAPVGYMSMTKRYTNEWLQWWKPSSKAKVSLYQFMAKDNVPFHSIMFPATLMATQEEYILVDHLMATEYLNYENGKFSKSRSIGVFGDDAKDTGIPSDIFRFYLLYIRPEAQDTNFSWTDLAMKNNTELLNNLGNFILRSLSFAEKFFDSKILPIKLETEDKELLGNISIELTGYLNSIDLGKFRDGIKYILNISRHGNQYMQFFKPWVLVKGTDSEKEKAGSIIALLCNVVCLISSLLQPFMPQTVETIAKQMNIPITLFVITETFQPFLKTGHKIGKPTPLFTKMELETVEKLKNQYAGKQKSESPPSVAKPIVMLPAGATEANRAKAISTLEEAIQKQGDLVRSMKAAGKSKDELKPMIKTLLDLKKQLEGLKEVVISGDQQKKQTDSTCPINLSNKETGDLGKVESLAKSSSMLEEEIATQGELVRKLKAAGTSKDALKPSIDKLLSLKKQLSVLKGEPLEQNNQSSSRKKKNKKN